jgi:hypothetical protein
MAVKQELGLDELQVTLKGQPAVAPDWRRVGGIRARQEDVSGELGRGTPASDGSTTT